MKTSSKKRTPAYLPALGVINSLGANKEEVLENLLKGNTSGLIARNDLVKGRIMKVGTVQADLPVIPDLLAERYDTRSNRLLLAAYRQIEDEVSKAMSEYGPDRVAVVLGLSTSGIAEGEAAMATFLNHGSFPDDYEYEMQEMGAPSEFLAEYLGLKSLAYTVSTACSSSAKVFASARNLIAMGLCDAVILGGVDSICRLTLNGFCSLEAVSEEKCNPFSKNRKGINIGEGAALFLMTQVPSEIELLGVGETSDASHITAPHPEGKGAANAMSEAMADAGIAPCDVDYVNLHGTGTQANDKIESMAMNSAFPEGVPCSSTKALTGHTLGAAGATEAAFCWLLLSKLNKQKKLAPQVWDKAADPELININLVDIDKPPTPSRLKTCLSSSFAFGGNNACVILGRSND